MNYYIDFDNTLYNTPLLTNRMLNSIVDSIREKHNLSSEDLYQECKSMFNREHIYNIYELARYFANKYSLDASSVINTLNNIILNGNDLVFEDTIPFLQKLKEQGHKLFMLTYCKESLEYQSVKVAGSKLADFFDAIYITSVKKYTLDIDYTNGIFIDDNPDDLLGLYSKNAKQVIRLRREGNKYSVRDLDNPNIKEYLNFNEIDTI